MKLTGKVALVTNASEFMGPAITEEFAREGATLALHDRDEAAAARIAALATALGRDTLVMGGDLTRSAEADRVVTETVARFGHLDILVNNSANPPRAAPPSESPTRSGAT
jgi:NAD(P)-dependent dehydrogenase (short-subunit alcohol dehydrogenase family)